MTLLDAYALVAFIADEPAAEEVETVLREHECGVVVANLAEAIDISLRIHGFEGGALRGALEPLLVTEALKPLVSDEQHAWLAAELRGRHYHKDDCAVSLADCLLIAHASAGNDAIATADLALARVAGAEGIEVIGLPDTAGVRP